MCISNQYDVIDCFCIWYDLLGFGKPFIDARWNLHKEPCIENYKRLKDLETFFSLPGFNPRGQRLYINDGIAATVDVSDNELKSVHGVMYWLDNVIGHYNMINIVDQRNGYPGIRGVLTKGHRIQYEETNMTESMPLGIVSYHPKEFQMNTAYSKAFIMEESGSAAGLKGPYLFVDKIVFEYLEMMFNGKKGYLIKEEDIQDNKFKVLIYCDGTWFLKLYFDKNIIDYDKKGIKTKLYKLDHYEACFDLLAQKEQASLAARIQKYENDTE